MDRSWRLAQSLLIAPSGNLSAKPPPAKQRPGKSTKISWLDRSARCCATGVAPQSDGGLRDQFASSNTSYPKAARGPLLPVVASNPVTTRVAPGFCCYSRPVSSESKAPSLPTIGDTADHLTTTPRSVNRTAVPIARASDSRRLSLSQPAERVMRIAAVHPDYDRSSLRMSSLRSDLRLASPTPSAVLSKRTHWPTTHSRAFPRSGPHLGRAAHRLMRQ